MPPPEVIIRNFEPNEIQPGTSHTFYDEALSTSATTRAEPYEVYVSSRYVVLSSSLNTATYADGPYDLKMIGSAALGQSLTVTDRVTASTTYELTGSVDVDILDAISASLGTTIGSTLEKSVERGMTFSGPNPPNSVRIWWLSLVYFNRVTRLQRYNTYDMYQGSTYLGRREVGAGIVTPTVQESYIIERGIDYP